jgi:asparagine synthase (glutamine-hydrolysing)
MLDEEFRHLFKSTLAESCLVQDGYLQGQAIHNLLSEHLARKADHGNRLWLLCNAEIWYRMAIQGWSKENIKQLIDSPHPS